MHNKKIGFLLFLILGLSSCNTDTKFDSKKWKKSGGESILLDIRLNMTNDLIESSTLIGKNESEIEEIIGHPTRLGREIDSLKYYAVQETDGWIDPEELIFLKIVFDEYGKSTSVRLYSTK